MKKLNLKLRSMTWRRSYSGLFGLAILLAVRAFATDYYVNPTNGNDANNGTSSSTPWKTVAKVNSSMPIFAPGDRILFKRGETFTGTGLVIRKGGAPGNPLVFGAYGTGNKPLFSGYSTQSTIITEAANMSDIILEDIAVSNVSGSGNMGIAFMANNNNNVTIRRCDVEAVGHAGIFIMCVDGYLVENCTVRNCGNAGIAVIGDRTYPATNGVIRNCIVDGVTDNDGITLHTGDTPECNLGPNHLIENNVCSNCEEQGIDITSGSNIILRSNRTSANGESGIVIGYNVRNVWIDKHISENESGRGIYILDSSFVKLTSSIIYHSAVQSLDISNCINFEAYNNTIIHNSADHPYLLDISGTVQNLTFKNNVFTSDLESSPSSFVRYLLGITPASTRSSFSHNLWWKPNLTPSTNMFYDDSLTRYNFNTWQSTYGQDEGSLINDPQLVSPQSQDFHIKSSSPCIDRGVDVGLSSDFYGTPIPQGLAPDIGVAEYIFSSSLIASADASPTSGTAPLAVSFSGSATGGTSPYSYRWTFGDGGSAMSQNPSHTYLAAGTFTATLTVTDSTSATNRRSLTITVTATASPLAATASADPTSGSAPLSVNFTGSAAGGAPPYTYRWNFGDGNSSSGQNLSHTYSSNGNYMATVSVTDSNSSNASATVSIAVGSVTAANLALAAVTGAPAPGQGGTTDPSPGNYSFSIGSTALVRSISNKDYRFSKWTGDILEEGAFNLTATLTMDTNKSLSATFCTKCADLDGDLRITPADAQRAFDIYLGRIASPTWCELENADVNCSGTNHTPQITPADAQAIFEMYLKNGVVGSDCSGNSRTGSLETQGSDFSDISLNISNAIFAPGQDVVITVIVESLPEIKAFGFDLCYPSDILAYIQLQSTELTIDFDQLEANILVYHGTNQERHKPEPAANFVFALGPDFFTKILTPQAMNSSKPSPEFDPPFIGTGNYQLLRVGGYKIKSTANLTSGVLVALIFRVIGEVKEPSSMSVIATYDDIKNATIKNRIMLFPQFSEMKYPWSRFLALFPRTRL